MVKETKLTLDNIFETIKEEKETNKNLNWKRLRFSFEKNSGYINENKQYMAIHPVPNNKINFLVSLKLVEFNDDNLDISFNEEFDYRIGTKEKSVEIKGKEMIEKLMKLGFKEVESNKIDRKKFLKRAMNKLNKENS